MRETSIITAVIMGSISNLLILMFLVGIKLNGQVILMESSELILDFEIFGFLITVLICLHAIYILFTGTIEHKKW